MDAATARFAGTVVGAVIKVFKSLKAVDAWMRKKTKGYDPLGIATQKYAGQLEERYNSMRIFGMSRPVPLRQIYVRVNILEKMTPCHRVSLKELEEIYDRDRRRFGRIQETKPGIDMVNTLQKALILGKPGSGKTTFLRYIALQALDGNLKQKRIPIFIGLKDWADSGKTLMDFIIQQFDICGFPNAEAFIERMLKKGACLLLLDGFDEMTGKVERAIQEIQDFSDKYSKNQFILSCRIAAYNYVFEKFTHVEMTDFDDDQIKAFVDNWFGKGTEKATLSWQKLNDPDNKPIKELASIPLLLAMLCMAFNEVMDFPSNRGELYKEAIDALLKKWDSSRSIKRDEVYKQLSLRRKESMLSRIAADTFEKGQYFIPQRLLEQQIVDYIQHLPDAEEESLEPDSEAVLKTIEAQHGLLVERATRIYSFSHLTVQEYFTARYMVENEARRRELIEEDHLMDDQWREVILLTAGMLTEADEFLLNIRKKISTWGSDRDAAEVLKMVSSSIKTDIPSNIPASRALGISLFADSIRPSSVAQAVFLTLIITRALDLTRAFNRDFARARALDFDRILDPDFKDKCLSGEPTLSFLTGYVIGSKLLVDCLNSGCCVSKDTRQRLLDGLLLEPWEG